MENKERSFAMFEGVPEKSKVQIIDDEIEMVRRNKFLSSQEKEAQERKLLEARKEYE